MKKLASLLLAAVLAASGITPLNAAASDDYVDIIVTLDAPEGTDIDTLAMKITGMFPGSESLYTYDTLLCGFHLRMPEHLLGLLDGIEPVENYYICGKYEPLAAVSGTLDEYARTAAEMIGIDTAEDLGLTGDGVKVAVIDNGFDITHPAFSAEVTDTLDLPAIAQIRGTGRLGSLRYVHDVSELFVNSKIPYVFDYADHDADVSTAQMHGTHVAGIIGAAPSDGSRMQGIAPDCQLLLMKVFDDLGIATSDYTLIAAMEDAVRLGADVINLSLGNYAGSTDPTKVIGLDQLIGRLRSAGCVVVCAAGNEGVTTDRSSFSDTGLPPASYTDYGTVSAPSTADYTISVGSVDNLVYYAEHFLLGDEKIPIAFSDTNLDGGVLDTGFSAHFDSRALEYVVIPGIGEDSDYAGLDVNGKLALIERGSITFVEKVNTAAAHGAVGAIISNNIEENSFLIELSGAEIPAVAISLSDGEALRAASDRRVTFDSDFQAYTQDTAGMVSEFSSWGTTPSLTLKPEICAVGGSVLSTITGSGYAGLSGTSMAAPQLTGVCALLIEKMRDDGSFSPTGIAERLKTLLMNTAVPAKQENGVEFSPRAQGAGVVDLESALSPGLSLTYKPNGKPKVELYDLIGDVIYMDLVLENLTDAPLALTLGATLTSDGVTELTVDGKAHAFSSLTAEADTKSRITANGSKNNLNRYADDYSPLSLTLEAGQTREVSLTIRFDKTYHDALSEIFTNGHFVEGFVYCESEDSSYTLPYLGYKGDWSKASVLDGSIYNEDDILFTGTALSVMQNGRFVTAGDNIFTEADDFSGVIAFSPNGDGVADTIYMFASFLRNVRSSAMSVTDQTGKRIYSLVDGYANKSKGVDSVVPGIYTWNGTDSYNDRYVLPDGIYTFTFKYTLDYLSELTQTYSYDVMIDTAKPVLDELSLTDGMLTLRASDAGAIQRIRILESDTEGAYQKSVIGESEASFDVSDYRGDVLYYEIIDQAYNFLIGRVKLSALAGGAR